MREKTVEEGKKRNPAESFCHEKRIAPDPTFPEELMTGNTGPGRAHHFV